MPGRRRDEQVLAVEGPLEPVRREPRCAKRARERAGREVRAVLVVEIPEGSLLEHPPGIRHLEERDGSQCPVEPGSYLPQERGDVVHVLECVPADDGACVGRNLLRCEEGLCRRDAAHELGRQIAVPVARIDGEPAPVRPAHQLRQEVAAAAPDLEHVAPGQRVPLDEFVRELGGVGSKAGREGLDLFVTSAVVVCRRIEGRVADEAASFADVETQVGPRVGDRLAL